MTQKCFTISARVFITGPLRRDGDEVEVAFELDGVRQVGRIPVRDFVRTGVSVADLDEYLAQMNARLETPAG
ncbi:MAG: hypothetical protein ABL912_01775 [Novosphingobium sp.]